MNFYWVAVAIKPTAKEADEGKQATIIIQPWLVIADNEEKAKQMGLQGLYELDDDAKVKKDLDMNRLEVPVCRF